MANNSTRIRERIRMLKGAARKMAMDSMDDPNSELTPAEAKAMLTELIECCNGDALGALGKHMRRLAGDTRGLKVAARDARELDENGIEEPDEYSDRVGRDARGRRIGRDMPEPFPGRPRPGGEEDLGRDRYMAGDMAFDAMYPAAARVKNMG